MTAPRPSDEERRLLLDALNYHGSRFTENPDRAEGLLAAGERPVGTDADRSEVAAYTAVVGLILNLDETLTKE